MKLDEIIRKEFTDHIKTVKELGKILIDIFLLVK